jgi:hypothetical protein
MIATTHRQSEPVKTGGWRKRLHSLFGPGA